MGPLDDVEAAARARLPAAVTAYYAGGSGDEVTLRAERAAWDALAVRPRVLRDVSRVDTGGALLGVRLRSPVGVAPTAAHGHAHPDGERATARGARAAGSLLVLSSRASCRLADVAAEAGPWWLQVYVLADRGLTAELVRRAVAAGARGLVLTGDTPVLGRKRPGAGLDDLPPPPPGLRSDLDELTGGRRVPQARDVTLDDVGRLAELSGGLPVVVKGVLRGDDAQACVAAGAAGVVVSTHGGRQLDGALPSARALPDVVAAVGGRVPVLVDGGVRRGVDVLRALALGADAVLVGRPVLWALAAGGSDGVAALLDGLRDDLAHAMALAGAPSLADVTPDLLVRP